MTTAPQQSQSAQQDGVLYRQENGIETWVDADVAQWLPRVWLHKLKKGHYLAYRRNRQTIYLHRAVMDCPEDKVVDHVNGDAFDNRRSNLRICSIAENVRNRVVLNKNNSSGRRGVFYDKDRDFWGARIKHNRKGIYLGRFATFDEAVIARKAAEMKYFGAFGGAV